MSSAWRIPQSLHKEYTNIVHKGHLGIEATKCRARSFIFWLAMSKDITESYTLAQCAAALRRISRQNLYTPPKIFTSPGKQYQVHVDSCSRWIEINLLRHSTTAVAHHTRSLLTMAHSTQVSSSTILRSNRTSLIRPVVQSFHSQIVLLREQYMVRNNSWRNHREIGLTFS